MQSLEALQITYKSKQEKTGETEHFNQMTKINITNEGQTDLKCLWTWCSKKGTLSCGVSKPEKEYCILSPGNIRQTHIEGPSLTQQAYVLQNYQGQEKQRTAENVFLTKEQEKYMTPKWNIWS